MALGVLDPNSRFEKSLGLLTTRFVNLLQEAEDGVLDLKVAADTLNVRQKRRIYDITNVLEGIGLIEKRNKNCIKWKGAVAGENTQEASERLTLLQDELNRLDQHERLLDQHTAWAGQSIRNIMEDESNIRLAYATHEDIAACCPTETVLAVRAPSGTQLEVPRPEVEIGGRRKYQIHLKTETGQIGVVLLEDGERDSIVVQVPPPAPSEVKEESSSGVKMEERRGVEVEGMKREREEEQDPREFAKRQRLEEGEIVPEEGDGFSDSEVEQTLQGAVPGFGHLQGMTNLASSCLPDFSLPTIQGEIPGLEDLMSSEMFGPLLRLSPPPTEKDYCFNLDSNEGVCDLFDVL